MEFRPDDRACKPERPPGPRINLLLAIIAQMLPRIFPFDPLVFGLNVARQFGDIAHYHVGPLHVYQSVLLWAEGATNTTETRARQGQAAE
jgi:hypothetical protein